MQEVAKNSPSTIEGHMMVVNRFDVHINGQRHPSSTPHEKALDLRLRQAVLTSSMSCRRENQSMVKV